MEGALQLEVGAVPLVLSLLAQGVGLEAAHGVVAAGELEEAGHLLHPKIPLF